MLTFTPAPGLNAPTPAPFDLVGFLPTIFDADDPRPAREQVADRYRHGGGWQPITGLTMRPDGSRLHYPGDPPFRALAYAQLRGERIIMFQSAFVAIVQPDGSYEVSRMD